MPNDLDVEGLEPEARTGALAEWSAHLPVELNVSPVGDPREFRFAATSQYFGSVFVASCRGRGAAVHLDRRSIERHHERSLLLSVTTSGTVDFQQGTRTIPLAAGDLLQCSNTVPFMATLHDAARHTVVVDYTTLGVSEHLLDTHAGRRIDTTHPLGRIVVKFLRDIATHGTYLPAAERMALEQPTLDLLRAMLAATGAATGRARDPLHETLAVRLEEYLRMHLRESDLNIARLASVHGISERYAYLVLARRGISLGDWLRTERLRGAAAELLSAPSASIASIAASWAFPDHANFTRAFRRSHGTSPSEYRASGRSNATQWAR